MKDYSNRIGERFETNEGYEVIIIEYNSYSDILVQFQDEYKAIVPSYYDSCKDGCIKNPYHP